MIFKNPIIILFYLIPVLSMQVDLAMEKRMENTLILPTMIKLPAMCGEKMDPNDRTRTYKPFHHIFQSNEKIYWPRAGGKFSPSRNPLRFLNAKLDKRKQIGYMALQKGYQVHENIEPEVDNQKLLAILKYPENRRWGDFCKGTAYPIFSIQTDRSIQIDFKSKLSTNKEIGLMVIHNTPAFNFEPPMKLQRNKNKNYIRPNEERDENGKPKIGGDRDTIILLWKAQCILVNEKRYTTIYMDHPNNPKPSFTAKEIMDALDLFLKLKLHPMPLLRLNTDSTSDK